jgi:dienelactone hydrolase
VTRPASTVLFETTRLGAAPALLARSAALALPLPAVLWYHGLSATKETHRPELAALARAGFLAVGIDAVGHGERRSVDFTERMTGPKEKTDHVFLDFVFETAAEVPRLLDALSAGGWADPERLAMGGVSMGAYVVYSALVEETRLRAAVALLGRPDWPRAGSPHLCAARYVPTPLLSITAGNDEIVPPYGTRALHREIAPLYADHPERLCYREIEGASHLMEPREWARSVRETVAWFERFAR